MERNKRDRMVYKDNCWVHTVQSRQSCENFNAKSMHVKQVINNNFGLKG